jgi:hypothetical protein
MLIGSVVWLVGWDGFHSVEVLIVHVMLLDYYVVARTLLLYINHYNH